MIRAKKSLGQNFLIDQNIIKKIIETIDNLSSELTIIIITHRPSTLLSCNRVIDLSKI